MSQNPADSLIRVFGSLLLAASLLHGSGEKAELRFELREQGATFTLRDLQFVSNKDGFLLGSINRAGRESPVVVRTEDGGEKWDINPIPEEGSSLYFADASRGWYTSELGIFRTDDGGKTWSNLGGPKGMDRVRFVNRDRGFAVGHRKRIYETSDGGESWKLTPAASEPESTPQRTVYGWVDFADDQRGLISGWSEPIRMNDDGPRKQWPTLSILLDTRDGGVTWKHVTSSMFGTITRVRLSPRGQGLGLIEFRDWFEWPSEVFRIDWRTGKSERVYRDKKTAVRDVGVDKEGSTGWLAGIGTSGIAGEFDLAGPLKLLRSKDLVNWEEVEVEDNSKQGRRTILSISPEGDVWVGVDGGAVYVLQNR